MQLAIDALQRASDGAPGHPDGRLWRYWLALGHLQRAESAANLSTAMADFERGVAGCADLNAELDADDPDRDAIVVVLIDGYWDRSWFLRHAPETSYDEAKADADRLLSELDPVTPTGRSQALVHYLALMRGLASLERYRYEPDPGTRARLDAGILLVDEALGGLATARPDGHAEPLTDWVDPDRLALAYGLLAEAYVNRGLLDERLEDADRSTEAVKAALAWRGPDRPPSTLLHTYLAEAQQLRWLVGGDAGGDGALPEGARDHLDAAIDAWQVALAHGGGFWCAQNLGDLLRERAARTGSAEDAATAVALLRAAAEHATDDGDDGAWTLWRLLALAGEVLSRLTGAQDLLVAATVDLDRALAHPAAPADELIQMHVNRIEWERQLARGGLVRTISIAPGAPTVFRTVVESAHRDQHRVVDAHPDLRAIFAAAIAMGEFSATAYDTAGHDRPRVHSLLALAKAAHGLGEQWAPMIHYAAGLIEHVDDLRAPTPTSDGGVGNLVAGLDWHDPDGDLGESLMMLAAARVSRMGVTGDRRNPLAGFGRSGRGSDFVGAGPQPGSWSTDASVIAAYVEFMTMAQDGDFTGLAALLARVGPSLEAVSESATTYPIVEMLRVIGGLADPVGAPVVALRPIRPMRSLLDLPELVDHLNRAMVLTTQGVKRGDLRLIRQAAVHLEALIDVVPAGDVRLRLAANALAGQARLELARRMADGRPDAARAAGHLQRALDIAGGHHVFMWANWAVGAAEALRRSEDPDRRRSRDLGFAAMRGHAWQVFAQAGTEHAIAAARTAALTARTVASWCLADRDSDPDVDEQLIAILDAGRGLVLRASTTSRLIAERLIERGRPDLAAEWEATSGRGRQLIADGLTGGSDGSRTPILDIPDELRLKVLHELGAGDMVGFEPISSAEVRDALRAMHADALVYLLPGEAGGPGAAVIVPAFGSPLVCQLPELQVGSGSLVYRYAQTNARGRDLTPVDRSTRHDELAELCEWAWSSAIGKVLQIANAWEFSRPVRLVLIPMGTLGLVPWHAARSPASDGYRYAVAEAVFSYTPSARTLCATAAHSPAPVRTALVVGDPGGDLPFAGLEAQAVHEAFYPDGSYFGRPARDADRPGTPDDVLDWIASAAPGPSMLHFACHGAIDPDRPAEAHLVLADGEPLSAGLLLERSRSAAMQIEQVFLAACTTSVTGHDHDEVLSLATSFLAAGARTVFGSLWPVPDDDTSVLMFMVHHFLRADACSPVDALHRAQLWMLDPARQVPDRMPKELQLHCGSGTAFGPVSWAGFMHLGR